MAAWMAMCPRAVTLVFHLSELVSNGVVGLCCHFVIREGNHACDGVTVNLGGCVYSGGATTSDTLRGIANGDVLKKKD